MGAVAREFTINGITRTVKQWAGRYGISYYRLNDLMRAGLPIEDAIAELRAKSAKQQKAG